VVARDTWCYETFKKTAMASWQSRGTGTSCDSEKLPEPVVAEWLDFENKEDRYGLRQVLKEVKHMR
jgi:hypothetical protein